VQQQLANTEKALAGDKATLAQFGLESPKNVITIALQNKEEKQLIIGNLLEFQKKNFSSFAPSSVYAMNPQRKVLLVVNSTQLSQLEKKTLLDFQVKKGSEETSQKKSLESTF